MPVSFAAGVERGPRLTAAGAAFAVRSTAAERIEVVWFDPRRPAREVGEADLERGADGWWSGEVPGLGAGALYGLRVSGPYRPDRGLRCNRAKLLVDPRARAVTGEPRWNPALVAGDARAARPDPHDSAPWMPRAVVVDERFDWGDDRPPRRPWSETVIYEAHVKGLTRLHPGVPEPLRGTYLGLAQPAVIEHLLALGVTAVELLPVAQHASEPHLAARGLTNYWGYSPLAPFAPHAGYATGNRGEQVVELKQMVRALHAAGLEVILDVVFNHTAEGGPGGPSLAWRGLDEALYYRLQAGDATVHEDFTGCGNTLDARRAAVLDEVFDCLRYWVEVMHVDGFRFDLAPTLGRSGTADPGFDPDGTFFRRLAADPLLAAVKLIAEPWDLGPGGYCLGRFPAGFAEWNDRFRDTARSFWRGDGGRAADLAVRLLGSTDVFAARAPLASINYVTAHDGFTLADVTSYAHKHNQANGENGHDGHHDNLSRNWGVEGPTDDDIVLLARNRARRSLLATLAFSRGVPMLLAGDELLHSQGGNNNAYCQDNATTWLDWSRLLGGEGRGPDPTAEAWLAYVRKLFAARRELAAARLPVREVPGTSGGPAGGDVPGGDQVPGTSGEAVRYLRPDGRPLAPADWRRHELRAFGLLLESSPWPLLWLVNGGLEDRLFRLPHLDQPGGWHWSIDTGHPEDGHPATPVVAIYAGCLGLLAWRPGG